jgi:hypothetical protein
MAGCSPNRMPSRLERHIALNAATASLEHHFTFDRALLKGELGFFVEEGAPSSNRQLDMASSVISSPMSRII